MVKSTLKLVAAIVLFASCNQFEKAPSGMTYKIKHGSGNEKLLQAGQYVKLHIEYKLKIKDLGKQRGSSTRTKQDGHDHCIKQILDLGHAL